MVNYSFHLAFWTVLFFTVGMFKPQWPLFFLKTPNRFIILAVTTVLVMITLTMYGEGVRRDKVAAEAKTTPKTTDSTAAPVPVPVPTPDKAKPEEKKPL
jgi:hypothetical protein